MNPDPDSNPAPSPELPEELAKALHAQQLNPPPPSWRDEILAAAATALPAKPVRRVHFPGALRHWGFAALWLLTAAFGWETHRLNAAAPVLNHGNPLVSNPLRQDWTALLAALEKQPDRTLPSLP